VRIILASTFEEHFGQTVFNCLIKSVGEDSFDTGTPACASTNMHVVALQYLNSRQMAPLALYAYSTLFSRQKQGRQ